MNTEKNRKELYERKKVELRKYFDKKWENYDLKNYHFLSANLSKFLPNIPKSNYKSFYFNTLAYKTLLNIDTSYGNNFNSIKEADEVSKKIKKQKLPGIFVSYHLGSFKSAVVFLIQANLDVVLILDPLPYKLQKDLIVREYEKTKEIFSSTSNLIIYAADRKDLTIRILSKTKENYSVLAYIDGNTGMRGEFNQANSIKLDFLGQKVFFRKGLAVLSYYTKCPLIPILSHYDEENHPHWEIKESIIPNSKWNVQEYTMYATVKMLKILEEALLLYPEQWEGWLYFHKFIEIEQKDVCVDVKNNSNRCLVNPNIGLFIYDGKYYVLDKNTYRILELNKETFLKLDDEYFNVEGEDIESVIFLKQKNILYPQC